MNCVLHPDREGKLDAQGIVVCTQCWDEYNAERRATNNGPISSRPFLQRLVSARHSKHTDVLALVALVFCVAMYVLASGLGQQQ